MTVWTINGLNCAHFPAPKRVVAGGGCFMSYSVGEIVSNLHTMRRWDSLPSFQSYSVDKIVWNLQTRLCGSLSKLPLCVLWCEALQ